MRTCRVEASAFKDSLQATNDQNLWDTTRGARIAIAGASVGRTTLSAVPAAAKNCEYPSTAARTVVVWAMARACRCKRAS